MKFVTTDGKVLQELNFKCGRCRNDVPCSLVFPEGGPPIPHDIPLHCGGCLAFVAMLNPSNAGKRDDVVMAEADGGRDFMAETEHLER